MNKIYTMLICYFVVSFSLNAEETIYDYSLKTQKKDINTISFTKPHDSTYLSIPDYSKLTKREKLIFLNGYGFVVTIENDTIYGVVRGNQAKGAATLNKKKQIKIKYPRDLEKYTYLTEISINKIKLYYSVSYRTFKYIRKVDSEYYIFDKIVEGKVSIYERNKIEYRLFLNVLINAGGGMGMGIVPKTTNHIYFENGNDSELVEIMNNDLYISTSKKEIKKNFINFFKDKVDREKLEKIKPRKNKLIEFVKKYNTENM